MSRSGENFARIHEVWRLNDEGMSQRAIAEAMGLARTSVQRILSRPRPIAASGGPSTVQELVDGITERAEAEDDSWFHALTW